MHFYYPEENPILDSVVRDKLDLGDKSYELCIKFHITANDFVKKYEDYFEKFTESKTIRHKFE